MTLEEQLKDALSQLKELRRDANKYKNGELRFDLSVDQLNHVVKGLRDIAGVNKLRLTVDLYPTEYGYNSQSYMPLQGYVAGVIKINDIELIGDDV